MTCEVLSCCDRYGDSINSLGIVFIEVDMVYSAFAYFDLHEIIRGRKQRWGLWPRWSIRMPRGDFRQ